MKAIMTLQVLVLVLILDAMFNFSIAASVYFILQQPGLQQLSKAVAEEELKKTLKNSWR